MEIRLETAKVEAARPVVPTNDGGLPKANDMSNEGRWIDVKNINRNCLVTFKD